ncbi:hypothetical protein FOCC_FOCC015036 [Frankliniella occidentalis]|nr:hypothetical protein FOCC_FOCC015036 [Frankliniella occidentalis]
MHPLRAAHRRHSPDNPDTASDHDDDDHHHDDDHDARAAADRRDLRPDHPGGASCPHVRDMRPDLPRRLHSADDQRGHLGAAHHPRHPGDDADGPTAERDHDDNNDHDDHHHHGQARDHCRAGAAEPGDRLRQRLPTTETETRTEGIQRGQRARGVATPDQYYLFSL